VAGLAAVTAAQHAQRSSPMAQVPVPGKRHGRPTSATWRQDRR
jgi:hypothetical protein